jgi:hypothetical protein
MKDIVEANDGEDLTIIDSIVSKAANVIAIQLGDLEYAPTFGIDKKFFLESEFQIQTESFQSYVVQRLTESQVNVNEVLGTVEALMNRYVYTVGDIKDYSGGFIL